MSEYKLNVGFTSELTISELKRKDLVTFAEVTKFMEERFNFMVAAAANLLERSSLGSGIVKHARCLNLKHFSSNAVESMKILLNHLKFLEIIPAFVFHPKLHKKRIRKIKSFYAK